MHTPGPWFVDGDDPEGAVTDSGPLLIHVVDSDHPAEDTRLIAAAPELLEALRDLLDVAEDALDGVDEWDARGKARAAIAKARGEA